MWSRGVYIYGVERYGIDRDSGDLEAIRTTRPNRDIEQTVVYFSPMEGVLAWGPGGTLHGGFP